MMEGLHVGETSCVSLEQGKVLRPFWDPRCDPAMLGKWYAINGELQDAN